MTTIWLSAAVDLAVAGWEVLPLNGKVPITAHGLDDATADLLQVTSWWSESPRANIGARVPRDLVVLDVDPRNGGAESLVELVGLLGVLPPTLTVLSGRGDGGHHRYFLRPSGSLKGKPAPGIDLKVNGYMVMPPSLHPATGVPYQWLDRAPVPLPAAWAKFLRVAPPKPRPAAVLQPGGDGAGLVRWVAELQEGNRNSGVYWAGCRLAELGLLDQLRDELLAAAVGIGLSEREARLTLASAQKQAVA